MIWTYKILPSLIRCTTIICAILPQLSEEIQQWSVHLYLSQREDYIVEVRAKNCIETQWGSNGDLYSLRYRLVTALLLQCLPLCPSRVQAWEIAQRSVIYLFSIRCGFVCMYIYTLHLPWYEYISPIHVAWEDIKTIFTSAMVFSKQIEDSWNEESQCSTQLSGWSYDRKELQTIPLRNHTAFPGKK